MARRAPIGIRKAEVRLRNYEAGVEAGLLKYKLKKDNMKKYFKGVAEFGAMVNNAVSDIADRYGIVGSDRGFLQSAAMRIARFAAKYYRIPQDALAYLLASQIDREIARAGYSPTSARTQILVTALEDFAAWAIENRAELRSLFERAVTGAKAATSE